MEQKRVKLANGIELDVVDEGPRDAPALIFLHGFPESHRTWRHQIAHFRSEEHTSELQSLMRISYAVFCLKKKRLPPNGMYPDPNRFNSDDRMRRLMTSTHIC